MKAKFKPGDAVLRIDGEDDTRFGVYKGNVYTISSVSTWSGWIMLKTKGGGGWNPNNFKLVEEEFGGNV